jgi:serine/threonine protein kinase
MNLSSQDWRRLFELLDGVEEPQREAWLKQLETEKGPIKDKLLELMSQRTAGDTVPDVHPNSRLRESAKPEDATLVREASARPETSPSTPHLRRRDDRRSEAPPPAPDIRRSDVPRPDTDSRWDSPNTWTGVFDEPVRVGRVLSGRYVIERELGEGGMGTVFLAQDKEESQPFAIKVMKEDFRLHPDALAALREEVKKSRELRHENIVGVYDLNRDRSIVYVKMEYLQGKSLDALLDEDFARGMPLNKAWPIIQGACAGLAFAHNDKGFIHSDIKPSNIFVTTAGKAKVLDFGIARAVRRGAKRYDPGDLGALTPAYASCEMLEHQEPDVRDDVYSLACVVYELLTGKHPFARQRATEARDKKSRMTPIATLTRSQNAALAAALAFTRATRTPSVEAFLAGLRDTRARRIRLLVRSAAAAAIVAAAVAGVWLVREQLQERNADQAYIATLLKPNAERSKNYDPQIVNDLLDQGEEYLRQARQGFDPALLSVGVSTAYGAFMAALNFDPANRKAAEGALAVVRLYQAKARSLEREQQYKRALELVTIALKLAPADEPLRALKEDLTRKVQSSDATQ